MTAKEKNKVMSSTCLSAIDDNTLQDIIGIDKPMMRSAFNEWVRREALRKNDAVKIGKSEDAFNVIKDAYFGLDVEHFYVIYLNRNNKVIATKEISRGGICGTTADPRIIFKHAIELSASAMILSHNHPSGNINPSQADIDLTNKISKGASLFDMKVLDHIIVANNNYYSFSDNGNL